MKALGGKKLDSDTKLHMPLKKIALLKPHKALSREQFDHYWREVHGPLVSRSPGYLRYRLRYVQNQCLTIDPQGLPAPWAGVAEFWLPADNEDEFAKTPIYRERIRPDEARFIDFDGTVSMTAHETIIVRGRGAYKLWLVSAPGAVSWDAQACSQALLSSSVRALESKSALSLVNGWEVNRVLAGSFRQPGALLTTDLDWALIHILRFDSLQRLQRALNTGLLAQTKGLHDVADVSFVTFERCFFDGQPTTPPAP